MTCRHLTLGNLRTSTSYTLDGMEHAKLILDLYNDYSNTSVGNDTTEAQTFSATITDDIYPYLMTANRSEYLEEIYYLAILKPLNF